MRRFETETYGKWILAGEHAVLRGVPALVLPIRNFSLKLKWEEVDKPLHVNFCGPRGEELKLIFWGLLEQALEKVGRTHESLRGEMTVESTLPLGAGLGASAALCVGVARFFLFLDWIRRDEMYEFARQLEGLFHGESSGVDIAVAIEGCGLRFHRDGQRTKLKQTWRPQLYLSYSGDRGVTSDCVRRVRTLFERAPDIGAQLDGQMREAVTVAEEALQSADEQAGVLQLAQAMDMARDCFYQWQLCEGALDHHMRELTEAGALAVKPTGSGGGGYVLSLWKEAPSPEIASRLIQI